MIKNKTALESILKPRFSAKVLGMSKNELHARIKYLENYLRNISPKVSIYMSLVHERDECRERLATHTF